MALAALTWGLPAPAERTARAQEETESSLRPGTTAARDYAARALRGFDVRVDRALLVDEGPDAALGLRALDALERDLASVAERVPPAALPRLRAPRAIPRSGGSTRRPSPRQRVRGRSGLHGASGAP
ncbi:MAG: hypothetical protein AAFZ87_13640, partial [Planctomycetota bacterium]